jgi:hypothetical protein
MTQAALGEALGLSTVHGGWREGEVIMSQHKGAGRIAVENVNYPGKVRDLDAAAYDAMRAAILKVLPSAAPGLTVAELGRKVATHLPEDIFPVGKRAGWWLKTVQLDLEAKRVIARERVSPLPVDSAVLDGTESNQAAEWSSRSRFRT